MSNPKFLVIGATGRTGSATIAALLSRPDPPSILALTCSPYSPKSQSLLSSHPSATITLVEGDPAFPAPVFASHKDISAIYLVTVPPADEAQGIPVIDAAVENGIPHVVLSSVDRGGDEESWTNPTPVPHFAAKHRLELYLRDRTAGTGTRWTVLRPAGFMDQYVSDAGFMGSVMGGLWASMPRDTRLQLVSARDIGVFAARAMVEGPGEWGGKALALAGDEISFAEAEETFERVVGRKMPQTWGFVAHAVRWASEDAGKSMEWFEREGYRADIAKLRAMEPGLQTWEMWLREDSGWIGKREN